MREIVSVSKIEHCTPKKGVWYNYFDTIFYSVMRRSKPHLRRETLINDSKTDFELSEWHFNWQYNLIEQNYGVNKYGVKSFERIINVDGESHRIDSVVDNIAIEFQHTLSVDIEEIDSRYNAHLKYGYIPYLVLDFTKYSIEEFEIYIKYNHFYKLTEKLKKWITCNYAKSNNLFIDLDSGIYRVVITKNVDSYLLQKETFVNELLQLENSLAKKIKYQRLIDDRNLIKEKWLKRREEVDRLNRKFQKEKELKELEEKAKQLNKQNYLDRKLKSKEFSSYRKCLNNSIIQPFIVPFENLILNYSYNSEYEDQLLKESHCYKDIENTRCIEFHNFSSELRIEKPTFAGYNTTRSKEYVKSIIFITKNSNVEAEIHWLKGKVPQLIDKNELTLF
ncbi:hypothetical protein R3X25_10065 [Lutibacter sp. TH_r2]|uniref:hypothetical protein n=1 Tax=Lutibacter sp. TH_r2 TaxID=3082083 RepID=UPI002954CB74|nr:hypothetical protein [Lutibacter sp. TH_r2]MDV7187625.1 hypothetical protein [Lutibacter sp. TH_r2]